MVTAGAYRGRIIGILTRRRDLPYTSATLGLSHGTLTGRHLGQSHLAGALTYSRHAGWRCLAQRRGHYRGYGTSECCDSGPRFDMDEDQMGLTRPNTQSRLGESNPGPTHYELGATRLKRSH